MHHGHHGHHGLGSQWADDDKDYMCLPALHAKSDQGSRVEGKRVYPRADVACQGSECGSLLKNDMYAWQFHSAAGVHTAQQSKASLRVYSTEDHSKLYDGLAGRPHVTGPPRPYDTPRRRFPGANVSQVDGLLRDDMTPLASEHPSQYGELYNGAAGVHKHWLLKPKAEEQGEVQRSCGGAGPSQVDEILLGRDIDGSTTSTLKQLEFSRGAAGCKSIGVAPKLMGKRCVPGGASEVDELIWGTDVDGSSDPVFLKAKDQLFRGAAGVPGAAVAGAGVGKMPLTSRGRRHLPATTSAPSAIPSATPSGPSESKAEGRRHLAGPADRVAFLLGKPDKGKEEESQTLGRGRRHIPAVGASRVDDIVLGRDIDGSAQQFALFADAAGAEGAAGRRCAGEESRLEGRRHLPAFGASRVDDVVLGKDIDGSAQQFATAEVAGAGAAGRRCVGVDLRVQGRRHAPQEGGGDAAGHRALPRGLERRLQEVAEGFL
ncbi:unnamed protein product [Symbiodinium natans]|uniref:Uncharacterized protein n=1 Tax=Symbiodinium natans TaxID=878477 RepID=A0A812K3E1_9DINO|nr:unnamed protein product [Symbiodinium natans]